MLIRTINGGIKNIERKDYNSDEEYYKVILKLRFNISYNNEYNSFNEINNYIVNK